MLGSDAQHFTLRQLYLCVGYQKNFLHQLLHVPDCLGVHIFISRHFCQQSVTFCITRFIVFSCTSTKMLQTSIPPIHMFLLLKFLSLCTRLKGGRTNVTYSHVHTLQVIYRINMCLGAFCVAYNMTYLF